jgi:hypothetical protein
VARGAEGRHHPAAGMSGAELRGKFNGVPTEPFDLDEEAITPRPVPKRQTFWGSKVVCPHCRTAVGVVVTASGRMWMPHDFEDAYGRRHCTRSGTVVPPGMD